jgi:WD40 repeat protein
MSDPRKASTTKELEHTAPLTCCAIDPKGRWIFAGSEDRSVVRWDLSSGKKTVLAGHDSWPLALEFTADGSFLISGAGDDHLFWWPTGDDEPKPARKLKAHEGWIRTLALSPDGKVLASAGNDRVVRLWNASDGTAIREMKGHQRHIYSLLWHPSGSHLLSGDLDGKIMQWDAGNGNLTRTLDASALHTYQEGQMVHYGGVRALALSADGKLLAAAGHYKSPNPMGNVQEPLVVCFNWEDGKESGRHTGGDDLKNHTIYSARYHADGWLCAATGGNDGILLFWNRGAAKPFFSLKLPSVIRGMMLHPDGKQLAAAHHDKKVRLVSLG